MGLLARIRAIWYALLGRSASDLEDKHVIALAETKLQQASERLKDTRKGLINYRALVLKVHQQVLSGEARVKSLTDQIKSHLETGREDLAAELALEMSRTRSELSSNEQQLKMHQEAYENSLLRMKAALEDIRGAKKELETKIAALQMEKVLAEVAETAGALNTEFNVSSDLGQILSQVDDQIDRARARARVASDLSDQDIDLLRAQRDREKVQAQEILRQFKLEEGLAEPSANSPKRKQTQTDSETE